ncbi:hypothetical protein YDYSG_19880 [Paenibacillus tyrfis]|uniref:hypothetical protein n=1 Tax=Paenibacillus tyrfis TaxID=1501230 RepID=UPI002492D51A|nr:hypothetical protein [Paenibacillus tyrfis]GLI05958.1 hypothetical protein YDYSG_19880 [Paenibacillus tyrfis]
MKRCGFAILLLTLILSACKSQDFGESIHADNASVAVHRDGPQHKGPEKSAIINHHVISNEKLGVRFGFPLDWSDRVYTRDTTDGIDFMYKAMEPNVEDTMLAKILVMSPVQYEVYQYHTGFYRELSRREGMVIARSLQTGLPYDDSNPIFKKDLDQYFKYYDSVDGYLNFIELTDEYDQRFYKSLKASSDSKDKELQDEFNKIIKERGK